MKSNREGKIFKKSPDCGKNRLLWKNRYFRQDKKPPVVSAVVIHLFLFVFGFFLTGTKKISIPVFCVADCSFVHYFQRAIDMQNHGKSFAVFEI